MVVIRMTWHIEAHFEEVRKLFTEIRPPESSPLVGGRAYQSRTGQEHTLALDWEFEPGQWEEFMPQFGALPENADKFRRWNELVRGGSTVEVWDLLESF